MSREPDLRAVFAVVSLWFNNQANAAVNRSMEGIIQVVSVLRAAVGLRPNVTVRSPILNTESDASQHYRERGRQFVHAMANRLDEDHRGAVE